MGLIDALIAVLSHPFGWLATPVVVYCFYACLRIVWDVLAPFTRID